MTGEQQTVTLLRFQHWPESVSLGQLGDDGRAALRLLAERPCAVADLPGSESPEVKTLLATLHADGWLVTTVCWAGRSLYTVQPLRSSPDVPATDEAVVLSRFTVLHREGDDLVVESPLATATVRVHDRAVSAVLAALVSTAAVNAVHSGLPDHLVTQLLADLRSAGLAVPADDAEDEPRLRQWRPHELWFHGRSRQGNGGYAGMGYGRTKWAKGTFDPTPARHDPYPGPAVELSRPNLDDLRHNDPPLTAVVEDRRSRRNHDDDHPITAEQLGELLYRCSGVRGAFEADGVEHLKLPYPAGGSVYELELYPVVRLASGLNPGMYHYDRHEHRLRLVREPGPEVARLLRSAALSASAERPPQVLIVLAARFGRLMYTYEELPYALVLKHVGVLYQTMYLAATAMGLAACGLGGGDAAAFTEATGLDHATESSVGEFMLGSRLEE
ncbi:SagB family peptide dehydrogenase [Kibdelosporangium persicum]|uniref:SagB family peptide dehydrogenase n=1 Tax=Kibdelosporangium persicum TaxID=2698649 RepID=UPI0015638311|nr:SagB family peptide dehydrogenase [Kibdelosporangium persicum]